tara:strand:- start:825 stop:1394 length:570 start_codon:yes stop_codon:yes gene_type:complete
MKSILESNLAAFSALQQEYVTKKSALESNLVAFPTLQQEYYTQNNVNDVNNINDVNLADVTMLRQAYLTMKSAVDSNLAAFSALQQEYFNIQNKKNKEHAALIADVNWGNLYAATSVEDFTRHSGSLLICKKYSDLTESHERDLVHELHDYEENGGDVDAIRQYVDAASTRVWDMFLTNYKCFLRNRDN